MEMVRTKHESIVHELEDQNAITGDVISDPRLKFIAYSKVKSTHEIHLLIKPLAFKVSSKKFRY
jgi:hypothetical protein